MSRRQLLALACAMLSSLLLSIEASQLELGPDGVTRDGIDQQVSIGLPCGVGFPPNLSSHPRILHGVKVQPGEFPWVANLRLARSHKFLCGGVIIDDRHILTVAHCFKFDKDINKKLGNYIFYIGDRDKTQEDGEQVVSIEQVMYYTDGDSNEKQPDDIALVRTKLPMKFGLTEARYGSVNNICLPPDVEQFNFKFQHGSNVTVAGWGQNEFSSDILMKVDESIFNCKLSENRGYNGTLCTWGPYKVGACHGDSGGPLVVESAYGQFVLAGLVQGGPPDCATNADDYDRTYANVFHYMPWIRRNTQRKELLA